MSFAPVPHACRAFLADFSAFIDGELPPGKRDVYQAHVDCCESCLAHLAAYRRGITVLRSLEESTSVDLWTRLQERLWLGPDLKVVEGGADLASRRAPRWSRPAVSLAAAAVVALFFLIRGLGPGTTPGDVGPRTVSASVGMTVPQVPPGAGTVALGGGDAVAPRSARRARSSVEAAPAGEIASAYARSETIPVLERELDRLRAAAFRQTLGQAGENLPAEDGWVDPVRLGSSWSRASFVPATLVRPVSAVRPAPWNVDRAVSLP